MAFHCKKHRWATHQFYNAATKLWFVQLYCHLCGHVWREEPMWPQPDWAPPTQATLGALRPPKAAAGDLQRFKRYA